MLLQTQKFLNNLRLLTITLIRIIILSRFKIKLPKTTAKKCIILGNGPSINTSIQNNQQFIHSCDLFCVNFFPQTDLYEKLKPSYLVVNAPELFFDEGREAILKLSENLFFQLQNKTTWKIFLMVPALASKYHKWKQTVSQNNNIKIVYYNPTPVEGFRWLNHFFFSMNLGMPRPHNVLLPSIMLALNIGYKEICLLGADHSWLPEITVDDNNMVMVNQKHFYDEKNSAPQIMPKKEPGPRRLHEVLTKFMHAFAGYFVIKEYAGYRHSKILNATPGSFIDAFERVKMK